MEINEFFAGQSAQAIDDKNRVMLPAKFRKQLGREPGSTGCQAILTKGLEKCLYVFPRGRWQEFIDNLKNKFNDMLKDVRGLRRYFAANAEVLIIDRQGRFVIPRHLKEYAKIDREIVIVGVMDRMEIWTPSEWQRETAKNEGKAQQMAEALGKNQYTV